MLDKKIKERGILAKLLEKGIEILLKKECKTIGKTDINIVASSLQIMKGEIQKIHIIAEELNYKSLFFDAVELEANDVNLIFKIYNLDLKFNENLIIKFKLSLSEKSLKKVLLSKDWEWIGDMISKEIYTHGELKDLKIENDKLFLKVSKENKNIIKEKIFEIIVRQGNLYLENKDLNKSIKMPIEDKVVIREVNIKNNLINFYANSSISW